MKFDPTKMKAEANYDEPWEEQKAFMSPADYEDAKAEREYIFNNLPLWVDECTGKEEGVIRELFVEGQTFSTRFIYIKHISMTKDDAWLTLEIPDREGEWVSVALSKVTTFRQI